MKQQIGSKTMGGIFQTEQVCAGGEGARDTLHKIVNGEDDTLERGRPAAVTSPRVRPVTGDRIWSRFGVSVGRNESGRWRGENDRGRWVAGGGGRDRTIFVQGQPFTKLSRPRIASVKINE